MKHAMMIKPAASIPLKDCFELFVLSGVKTNNFFFRVLFFF